MMHKPHELLLLIALLLSLVAVTEAQQPKRYGSLNYPAPGNIDFDEGTVELWFITHSDTSVLAGPHNLALFDIVAPQGENWHFFLGALSIGQAPKSLTMVGFCYPRQSYVWGGKLNWMPGELHHVAWTWKGRLRSLYIDGRMRQTGPLEPALQENTSNHTSVDVIVEGWLHGTLTGTRLCVGMQYSFLTIDEVRISSIARSAQQIAEQFDSGKAPQADQYTLLLDHCDGGAAQVISGFNGESGGTLAGACKVIDGRFGKAIQLWTED